MFYMRLQRRGNLRGNAGTDIIKICQLRKKISRKSEVILRIFVENPK